VCDLAHTSEVLLALLLLPKVPVGFVSGLYGPVTIRRTLWPRRACESERRVARRNALFLRWIVAFGALACVALTSGASAKERRSREVTREFQREHPCPSTRRTNGACPGYTKDHIKPLACGGADAVSNMQWQTIAAAKAKDRWELRTCGPLH
jgi:hypothetical protein